MSGRIPARQAHPQAAQTAATHPARTAKLTQRARILSSATDVFAGKGYASASIEHIIAKAGVSRPTFYDYFPDKEACLFAVLGEANTRLHGRAEAAVQTAPREPATATVDALIDFCAAEPPAAKVLINTSLAAGALALTRRDELIADLTSLVGAAERDLPNNSRLPDIAHDVLLGGILRTLGARMRRNEPVDSALGAQLSTWVNSYAVPLSARRWDSLGPRHVRRNPEIIVEPPFGSQPVAPKLPTRTRDGELQRQRLFYATGELAKEQGLQATSIADITRRAGVGYRRFVHFFADKQEAFLALHDIGYRRALAATVGAYFSAGSWEERTWAAGQAYVDFVARNPTIAHIGFVEPYSAGPRSARRMDEVLKIFTLFLHEGYAHMDAARPRPSATALEAIAATIFEIGFQQVRRGDGQHLPGRLPHAMYLLLAPFIGTDAAATFIDRQLTEHF